MSTITVDTARAEALFVTHLQPSESRTADQVHAAIRQAIRQHGSRGCAARVAAEFGDHPETAVARMRWAIAQVRHTYPQRSRPARAYLGRHHASAATATNADDGPRLARAA